MADVFLSSDARSLLENKYVIIMGDSVQRSIYKDFVCMLQQDQYLTDKQLRCKGDLNFLKDTLIEGGKLATLSNSAGYREMREYHTDYHLIKFYFITRCYYSYVEKVLESVTSQDLKPDIFILNSCVWDISRYGPNGVGKYKENLLKLVKKLKSALPEDCLVIWNTTLPISSDAKGGFLVPEVEFMTSSLHLDILQANFFAQKIMTTAGFDVLDLHYYLRHHIHRRAEDGIHWDMTAHRRITNLLLTHISEAWGKGLPRNVDQYTSIDTEFLAQTLVDNEANNNNVAQEIAQRPKVKARRRKGATNKNSPFVNMMNMMNKRHKSPSINMENAMMSSDSVRMVNAHSPLAQNAVNGVHSSFELQAQIMTMNRVKAAFIQNGNMAGSGVVPNRSFSSGSMNLPMMVDPQERYGGPVNRTPYNHLEPTVWTHAHRSPYAWQTPCMDPLAMSSMRSPHMPPLCVDNQLWYPSGMGSPDI
ncbi:PC-esterase domain-containing protein 1B-like [Liolophura sinensis]|uniref:PC-esterase domain-containing protein 1B-like n=1 Tax=Liolophura sinensis TaxID=3198878 RepID=UPI003158DEE1